ncbi:MAG: M18 family aminopeptidase [Deltaproteobacteria bacterium]|nr:M18 family aminopeptidase [Deltaproteobacteria bacterium]
MPIPTSPEDRSTARAVAEDLLAFLDASPCAFHAVAALRSRLVAAGFEPLSEGEPWRLHPGGRHFVERGGTALSAFVVGTQPPSTSGYRVAAAHTDSPGLVLKPLPERVDHGTVVLGVEVYGGPVLATWMDRDLGLCGRVVLEGREGRPESRLWRSEVPLVCLPNLAIHQNRQVNDEGLKVNPQTEITPMVGTLDGGLPEKGAVRHLLAADLGVADDAILAFDLRLFDAQNASFAGAAGEFVRSGRLDDLAMCHAILGALLTVDDEPSVTTRVAVFYDSEEVGSQTTQGAHSTLLPALLERIAIARGDARDGYLAALARSILVSADNAHAVHPGFSSKLDPDHAPVLNGGPVLKAHASRAYATDAASGAAFLLACRQADVPFQWFVNRSDVKSGSTIGSMVSAQLGIPVVDVGSAQYAMHSVRETAGAFDPWYMTRAIAAWFRG